MKVVVGAVARQEIEEAKSWYDRQQDGLGLRFVQTIEATILRMVRFPRANSEIAPGIRRALVAYFPYMVIYACDEKQLSVIAVAHHIAVRDTGRADPMTPLTNLFDRRFAVAVVGLG